MSALSQCNPGSKVTSPVFANKGGQMLDWAIFIELAFTMLIKPASNPQVSSSRLGLISLFKFKIISFHDILHLPLMMKLL